jgi:hypothetical protein
LAQLKKKFSLSGVDRNRKEIEFEQLGIGQLSLIRSQRRKARQASILGFSSLCVLSALARSPVSLPHPCRDW